MVLLASDRAVRRRKSGRVPASLHNDSALCSSVSGWGELPAYGSPSDDGRRRTESSQSSIPCRERYQNLISCSHGSRSRFAWVTTAKSFPVSCCSEAKASARAAPVINPLIEITRLPFRNSARARAYGSVSFTLRTRLANAVLDSSELLK